MLHYKLTEDAEQDLREVARYTLDAWGRKSLEEYRDGLKKVFVDISENKVMKRRFSQKFPEVFVTKYKYHYIFYVVQPSQEPVILGVIHERRDIVNRLHERLT